MAKVIDVDVLLVNTEDVLHAGELEKAIAGLTENERKRLFVVVATGGTTNAGIIDDLDGIANICEKKICGFM